MTTAVYKLQRILDNPEFEGFGLKDEDFESPLFPDSNDFIDDFDPAIDSKGRPYVRRLAPLWREIEVEQAFEGQVNDYPCIALMVPAFSGRAVDALRDLLEPNGEILPLKCKTGRFYAYNVTTLLEALDHEKSIIKWFIWLKKYHPNEFPPPWAERIDHYEFIPEKLTSPIFRMPEEGPRRYYVTEEFKERVDEYKLRGFDFIKIWPLPRPKKRTSLRQIFPWEH